MNFEDLEHWAITHCPKQRYAHRLCNAIKRKHVARYSMKQADIQAVEANISEPCEILKRYEQPWSKDYQRVVKQIEEQLAAYKRLDWEEQLSFIKSDMLFCRYAYGFMPDEYIAYQLKEKTPAQRKTYLSDRDRLSLIYQVNDMVDMDVVRNKNLTYHAYPRQYGRAAVSITKDQDLAQFQAFVKDHPVFVQKNVRKNCGQGVKLVDFSACAMSGEAYFKQLRAEDEFLLEELIRQSKTMSKLNASSVNTVRCVTLMSEQGVVVDHCFLKVGRNHSFLDNGAAGGLLVGIDHRCGKLDTHGYSELLEVFEQHPDSKVTFLGYQLPQWDQLLCLAKELAASLPTVRFVGWDLAHTDAGWILVEGNGRSQVIGPQLLYGTGYKQHFSDVLKVDIA